MNNQIVRWGIIGSGRIARAFAEGLSYTQNGKLCAIASRNLEKAGVFAKEWNITVWCQMHRHDSGTRRTTTI
jgi:predicted dehydrogenase